VKGIG